MGVCDRLFPSVIKIQLIISHRVFVERTRVMLTGKENGRLDHIYNVQHGETGTPFAQQWVVCVRPGDQLPWSRALTG